MAYGFLDLIAVGMGMGVPIFAILFGLFVGWTIPAIVISGDSTFRQLLKDSLLASLLASCFTVLILMVIWGPATRMLLDPSANYENYGIPMILYEPKASFIGWMVLMMIISPALQFLAAVFSSVVRIIWKIPNTLREQYKSIISDGIP
jgi:hypothetical protein